MAAEIREGHTTSEKVVIIEKKSGLGGTVVAVMVALLIAFVVIPSILSSIAHGDIRIVAWVPTSVSALFESDQALVRRVYK